MPQLIPEFDASCLPHELPVRFSRASRVRVKLREHPPNGEKARSIFQSRSGSIAAPPPVLGGTHHPSSDRIQHNGSSQLLQVALLLDENGFVSALEDMAGSLVQLVDPLRVSAVDVTHSS